MESIWSPYWIDKILTGERNTSGSMMNELDTNQIEFIIQYGKFNNGQNHLGKMVENTDSSGTF